MKKRRRNPVFFDHGIQKYTAHRYDKNFGNIYASGSTKKQALTNLRDRLRGLRRGGATPSNRGYAANPHKLAAAVRRLFPPSRYRLVRVNPQSLVDVIRRGDRVTIVNRFGQTHTGKAVMRSSSGGWVLNMGGRYGTPGLADDSNIVKVKK